MSVNKNDNDKIICECGSLITNQNINISQHQKTLKHKKYLENKSSKPEEEKEITEIDLWVKKEVEESVVFAENSPYPEAHEIYEDVYTQTDYPYIKEYLA